MVQLLNLMSNVLLRHGLLGAGRPPFGHRVPRSRTSSSSIVRSLMRLLVCSFDELLLCASRCRGVLFVVWLLVGLDEGFCRNSTATSSPQGRQRGVRRYLNLQLSSITLSPSDRVMDYLSTRCLRSLLVPIGDWRHFSYGSIAGEQPLCLNNPLGKSIRRLCYYDCSRNISAVYRTGSCCSEMGRRESGAAFLM